MYRNSFLDDPLFRFDCCRKFESKILAGDEGTRALPMIDSSVAAAAAVDVLLVGLSCRSTLINACIFGCAMPCPAQLLAVGVWLPYRPYRLLPPMQPSNPQYIPRQDDE